MGEPSDFQVGDFVYFFDDDHQGHHGYIDREPDSESYWRVMEDIGEDRFTEWGVFTEEMTLVYRPLAMDQGSEEYDLIMTLQATYPDGIG